MKKILITSIILNILISLILIGVLNTKYEFEYCNNNECYTVQQKIFDYIIGRD